MRSLITLLLCLIAGIVNAQGTLMTVAGTGVAGFSGDGGDARLAQVSYVGNSNVVVDTAGNIFLNDIGNYRIRKIDGKTGIITTFAGNGGRGYSGDGGPATSAQIGKPWYITLDWKGNLLFYDTAYCRIRSITPSGMISYWGGTACGDDGDGGSITAAKIDGGTLVAADSGKLYISTAYKIRCVDPSRIIRRFAGSTPGFSGDGGPALSAQFNNIEHMTNGKTSGITIADASLSRRVRNIDDKGIINTIAGSGSGFVSGDGGKAIAAGIGILGSVTYDQFGNLYFFASSRIRRVDAKDSIITTIAGTGVPGYSGEGVDAKTSSVTKGYIYFDTGKYELYFFDYARVRKITNLIKPVSISEVTKTYSPEIFPNPANTKISVSGIPIRSEIWIYDLLGREHLHTTMSQMEVDIDVSCFAPCTYILRAKTPIGQEVHAKFVKQ